MKKAGTAWTLALLGSLSGHGCSEVSQSPSLRIDTFGIQCRTAGKEHSASDEARWIFGATKQPKALRVTTVESFIDDLTGYRKPAEETLHLVEAQSVDVRCTVLNLSTTVDIKVVANLTTQKIICAVVKPEGVDVFHKLVEAPWGLKHQAGPVVTLAPRSHSVEEECRVVEMLENAWNAGLPIIEAKGIVVRPVDARWHYPAHFDESGSMVPAEGREENCTVVSSIGYRPKAGNSSDLEAYHEVFDSECQPKVGFESVFRLKY